MTQNQINAASVAESGRHNSVTEAETERHNKATESIDNDRNNITQQYNERSLDLQEKYNDAKIALDNADLAEKERYQKALNELAEQQLDLDAWYKGQMTDIQSRQQSADQAYKESLSRLGLYNYELDKKKQYYEQQKTEAYMYDLVEQRKLSATKLEQEKARIENEYKLGIISAQQRERELALKQKQYDLELKQWDEGYKSKVQAETKLTEQKRKESIINSAIKAVEATADVVDSIIPF